MKTALVTLSAAGARLLAPLAVLLPDAKLYIHESVQYESFQGALDGKHWTSRSSQKSPRS